MAFLGVISKEQRVLDTNAGMTQHVSQIRNIFFHSNLQNYYTGDWPSSSNLPMLPFRGSSE